MTPRKRLFKAKRADLREPPVCVECLRCGRRNVVLAAKSLPLTLLTRRLKCPPAAQALYVQHAPVLKARLKPSSASL